MSSCNNIQMPKIHNARIEYRNTIVGGAELQRICPVVFIFNLLYFFINVCA